MVEMLVVTAVSALIKEGLKEENLEKAAELVISCGKKLSAKTQTYLKGHDKNGVVAPEVREEVESALMEVLKSASRPVYMGGIAFFCDMRMDAKTQENLTEILINSGNLEWESEEDNESQRIVDDFMENNYGRTLVADDRDYVVGADFLYLNLAFDDDSDYFRLYDGESVRRLADALNHLLGERYITKFTTY